MQKHLMEYLDTIVQRVPEKLAFSNGETCLTFHETREQARRIGSFLSAHGHDREPVVVFMARGPRPIVAFFGVLYAGCYYVALDQEMPAHRIELILRELRPKALICDDSTCELAAELSPDSAMYHYDEMILAAEDADRLADRQTRAIDTDPAYIVFTSGSTGIPKGVIANHRSVIRYVETLSELLDFGPDTVFGNQTPLYFDACLKEIIPTLKFGAATYIIPKQLFMFPLRLVEYLNTHRINTICWVVSALTMVSGLGVLEQLVPEHLKTIAFASEVFPIKQFNRWRQALPEARFINLYGPTETTGVCCYYEVDREFQLDEVIPIGRPFPNTEILLLDEHQKIPAPGQPGEICIRGTSLTMGYYRDPEKTQAAFVQNPLNDAYPELIYRTGDLGRLNERGELVFMSRLDQQIKHMGHRIELGEIEVIAGMYSGVEHTGCLYDHDKQKIWLFYVGSAPAADVSRFLRGRLPRYMLPNVVRQLDTMPLTSNRKIDRQSLRRLLDQTKPDRKSPAGEKEEKHGTR